MRMPTTSVIHQSINDALEQVIVHQIAFFPWPFHLPMREPGAQPRATSSAIISANPIIAPMVEVSVSLPCWASGISSSTTT